MKDADGKTVIKTHNIFFAVIIFLLLISIVTQCNRSNLLERSNDLITKNIDSIKLRVECIELGVDVLIQEQAIKSLLERNKAKSFDDSLLISSVNEIKDKFNKLRSDLRETKIDTMKKEEAPKKDQ